jgi:hypothetical protein
MKLEIPEFEGQKNIFTFRGIHVLCDIIGKGSDIKLKATHFASCTMGGPVPRWSIWTVNGKFKRYFTYRSDIENSNDYKSKIWKRIMLSWKLDDIHDLSIEQRRALLDKL